MRKEFFAPVEEAEGRLLLLIAAFSGDDGCLEGRTKLAKLDFLLRHPDYLKKAIRIRGSSEKTVASLQGANDIESRMVRYRYGPWDPSYFTVLGRLLGKGLITAVPYRHGVGFRVSERGRSISQSLAATEEWEEVALRSRLLKSKLDLSGTGLKEFIYQHFREVADADWGDAV